MVMASLRRRITNRRRKRLRFSRHKEEHDRTYAYIPVIRERRPDEKPGDPKKKDRGVLIIRPDGSSKKMAGLKK
jgi:hypothetical protein